MISVTTPLVSQVLLLVQLDEAGLEIHHSRGAGGWIWFDREKLRAALVKPNVLRAGLVFGPFKSAVEAGRDALTRKTETQAAQAAA